VAFRLGFVPAEMPLTTKMRVYRQSVKMFIDERKEQI